MKAAVALIAPSVLSAVAALLTAAPAAAGDHDPYASSYGQGHQAYGRDSRYGQGGYYGQGGHSGPGYDYSYGGQRDVPGDYRCDAYWDRGRTDCNAAWRDQRGQGYGYGYGQGYGYGYDGRHGHDRGGAYYASQGGRGYGRGTTYYGAYGQPDVVYAVPTGGYGHGSYGDRNRGRSEWCRATYRSYDPRSGYYRAYSGRLVYCG